MSFGRRREQEFEDSLPIEDEDLSSHREARPLAFLCGTRSVAGAWIAPAMDLITEQAPDDRPRKK